jgi:hypothetical protein
LQLGALIRRVGGAKIQGKFQLAQAADTEKSGHISDNKFRRDEQASHNRAERGKQARRGARNHADSRECRVCGGATKKAASLRAIGMDNKERLFGERAATVPRGALQDATDPASGRKCPKKTRCRAIGACSSHGAAAGRRKRGAQSRAMTSTALRAAMRQVRQPGASTPPCNCSIWLKSLRPRGPESRYAPRTATRGKHAAV